MVPNKNVLGGKMLETNKICVHYGKQIEVLSLQEFNNLMRQRIKKTNKENESKQILLFIILFITFFTLCMKVTQILY